VADEQTWLDPAVLEYIKNNDGKVGSPEVVNHFKLRCDITLFALNRLVESGKIEKRELYENNSVYFVKELK